MSGKTKSELKAELIRMQEKLYEAGIEKRPTMMNAIEQEEAKACETIVFIIKECEEKTGRTLFLSSYMDKKYLT